MFTFFRPRIAITIWLLTLLLLLSTTLAFSATEWVPVPGGRSHGISGMALLKKDGPTKFLVVHDRSTMPRLGIVTPGSNPVGYSSLQGKNLPVNLEAVSAIPDENGKFLALSSDGQVFLLTVLDENNATSERLYDLPQRPPNADMEGLSVQKFGVQLVIVWGHRGAGKEPGLLYWGLLDRKTLQLTNVTKNPAVISQKFLSPEDKNTRHIADLKVDENGVVWASATNDPEAKLVDGKVLDVGPFKSGVYILGVLCVSETSVVQFKSLTDQTRTPEWAFERKVEAIELVPGPDGGIAFGAEDEDNGGWLYFK